ncbi:hypothetical protein LX77_03882 [Gelidibacter algens]|uniref:Lipocalin-like protein n=1 Tax=Gelidibacter algens TaxID=49280 RepID=A0A1A7QLT5_9FLAO|nr:hypothetical protein [Gelidibacter algens]OBX21010.1 hypothetical protein A9996_18600 [Gelidibacter algens]RAJ17514.1 hypothetical protein LX77_03882 [Gelidibacter algens]
MKNLKIIALLILVGIYSSCNNDDENITQTLSGIYSETSPVSGRSQLNFINGNTVVKSEPDNSNDDEFTYEIIGNVIRLTPTLDNSTTQEFEIEIMTNSKFEIENLYPSVGINPTTYMTFEK